jgi:hypothetical protein
VGIAHLLTHPCSMCLSRPKPNFARKSNVRLQMQRRARHANHIYPRQSGRRRKISRKSASVVGAAPCAQYLGNFLLLCFASLVRGCVTARRRVLRSLLSRQLYQGRNRFACFPALYGAMFKSATTSAVPAAGSGSHLTTLRLPASFSQKGFKSSSCFLV